MASFKEKVVEIDFADEEKEEKQSTDVELEPAEIFKYEDAVFLYKEMHKPAFVEVNENESEMNEAAQINPLQNNPEKNEEVKEGESSSVEFEDIDY